MKMCLVRSYSSGISDLPRNGVIDTDRRLTVREISEDIGISKTSVHWILRETLGMSRVCARWVPLLITEDEKE